MELEILKPENMKYLEKHEVFGFKSKTDMINEALDLLRRKRKQKIRRDELVKAGKNYAQDNEYAWADLDGDNFED